MAKRKIILVDDSVVNRKYLREMLESSGYDVIEATKGVEALEIIASEKPDAMILDLLMPGITGLETLISIRARGFTFPIIIHTADYKEDVKRQCMEAGATAFIYKPAKPSQILNVISHCFPGSVEKHE
jgi:CheY-like chemotaxis protein